MLNLTQFVLNLVLAFALGALVGAERQSRQRMAGLLPGYKGTLSEVQRLARATQPEPLDLSQFLQSLLTIEVLRGATTIVMLVSVAMLAAGRASVRCAIFLWTFALWDVSYHAGLWATIRWPPSLKIYSCGVN